MKPFENAQVGQLVYLPNQDKGYPIVNIENDRIQVRFGGILPWFDMDGVDCQLTWLGQIIYPYPVAIQDARNAHNCGNKGCINSDCYKCDKDAYWQPQEDSCK